MRGRATLAGLVACLAALGAAAPAAAEFDGTVFGDQVACEVQGDGIRLCSGLVETWDGQRIDVNVALPPEPASGADGPYPLVGHFHGWGGKKIALDDNSDRHELRRWVEQDYAAFSMTARGFGRCGAKPLPPADCLPGGYVRLMDTRYEVRDAQHLMGMLVDDGVADPAKVASVGGSYGGGMSMALAALRNRTMEPDGDLVPWTSPGGQEISLAAAAPEIPWTDLAYSLMPNGRTLDYVADAPYRGPDGTARIGVKKETFVDGLFAAGQAAGLYAPPGVDPQADLNAWWTRITSGEPYDGDPLVEDIVDQILAYHSSYYIDPSVEPAPLLISNGWTDDIFPADEALRFYNRTLSEHPDAEISLFFLDYGHQRGQNKQADLDLLTERQDEFLAHHLANGPAPELGERVTALTQTCPKAAPSGGPFTAPSWQAIAPGEVRGSFPDAQTINPTVATDAERGRAYDPITGPGACATAPGSDQVGAASYRLDPAPAEGYTLMGSPTVIADFSLSTPTSQVAARLLDVAPDGSATLIARGLWRPATGGLTREVFQLHPNGWRFAPGHVAKLELLPSDTPYGRPSNGQGHVIVQNLELRLPVLEEPGSASGVGEPAPKVLPEGYAPARGYPDPVGPGPPGELPRCLGVPATIVGSAGDDVLRGSRRRDVVVARGGSDDVGVGRGPDLVCAGGGDDVVRGGQGADRTAGGPGADRLGGGRGPDRLGGGGGPDALRGGRGRDRLWGGRGADELHGGKGRDWLDGRREGR